MANEINTKTKYFTQRRICLPGHPGKWEKICNGHEEYDQAVICAEKARAIYLGEMQRNNPVKEALDAEIRATYLAIIAAGGTVELCLSKFTVMREMIEDFGIIKKTQVKKEVP